MGKGANSVTSIANSTGNSFHAEREKSAKELNKLNLRTQNQKLYSHSINTNKITFAVGPAGTGKSHIATVKGLEAVLNNEYKKLILYRPPVECGPKQGFLPGDLADKTDPYMLSLKEIAEEYIGYDEFNKMLETGKIQIGYLGYIRGSTFNNSWVVLDEAQNVTIQQMKMFLTRLGKTSKIVVNGDITQIDLPIKQQSCLEDAINRLEGIDGIGVSRLEACDNQRDPLVAEILKRYE